jgi:pyrimidine operon attenuation protein/uracil phosphoribosyltransferase
MSDGGRSDVIILMDDARIRRTLKRISYEIAEKNYENSKNLCFVGLNERGFKTAEIIRNYVEKAGISTGDVIRIEAHEGHDSQIDQIPDLSNRNVILVDDVIFSGKTMLRALGYILKEGEPEMIQIAVLVDRGHRVFPVLPTYVGMHYPTKLKEHIVVDFGGSFDKMSVLMNSDYGI